MQWNDEIVGLWPTPLTRGEITDPSVLTRLSELCEGAKTSDGDDLFASDDAAIQRLRETIAGAAQAYFEHLQASPAPEFRVRGRLDQLQYGESWGLRSSAASYLCGVLYLRTPKDTEALHLRRDAFPGFLTLVDPRPGFNMLSIKKDPYREQAVLVEPEPGLLLMWPGNVNYYRHPHLSRTPQLAIWFEVVPADTDEKAGETSARWDGDIRDMWSTGLIKRRLPEYEQRNPELIQIIDGLESENPDLTTDFNSGQLHQVRRPAVDWLMANINQSVSAYVQEVGMDYPISWDIASWPNINRFGDYHSPHNHPWSYLSGTYYIQIPDAEVDQADHEEQHAACISHYDPRSGTNVNPLPPGSRADPIHTIKPVPGALLMWPSSVYHFVHPNLSQQKRYTLSFNIHLKWERHYL